MKILYGKGAQIEERQLIPSEGDTTFSLDRQGKLIVDGEAKLKNESKDTCLEVKSFLLWGYIIAVVLTQSACNPFMVFRPDSEELVKKGWAKQPCNEKDPPPLYCYQSLGHKVCHSAPLDSQSRLESYYGPRPY